MISLPRNGYPIEMRLAENNNILKGFLFRGQKFNFGFEK
ncbi:MAG: hypothetical protein ACI9DK_000582 [Vicingaceae bacterium]|jgi:hypothetical protein